MKPTPKLIDDFQVQDHGSIMLLKPMTADAHDWVAAHIPSDAQFFGSAVVVEPRYMDAIVDGIQDAGLAVA